MKKTYVSFPMTYATPQDNQLIADTVAQLHRWGVEVYDPRNEPLGLAMPEIQAWDFEQLAVCDNLLAIWSPTAHKSGGVLAELEWARRIFGKKIAVYRPQPTFISKWTVATVRGNIFEKLEDAVRFLGIEVPQNEVA